MSYHVVSIDSNDCRITVDKEQLKVISTDGVRSVPMEDVSSIVITSFKCDISINFFHHAAKYKIGVVFCETYKPVSVLLPVDRATDTELIRNLSRLTPQFRRRLWKKTIDAKCHNQYVLACKWCAASASNFSMDSIAYSDKDTKEAECAKLYWRIFSERFTAGAFRRDKAAQDCNSLFNYAYAILLSCVLRNLLAFGIDPTFGIFHTTRAHAAPLAYDLMEPFRPLFDEKIAIWLTSVEKTESNLERGYITTEFRRYIASTLVDCYNFKGERLALKQIVEKVIRTFRNAVIQNQTGIYEPWKT